MVDQNKAIISRISNKNCDLFVDLPLYYKKFRYPVSLEAAEFVGQKAYQNEVIDPIGFLCILGTKIYTSVRASNDASSLGEFIIQENPEEFKEKTSKFIRSVKLWESKATDDHEFSKVIEGFCLSTHGVRLPVLSFFLRTLQPKRFGTLDERATSALMALGFKNIKQVPKMTIDKSKYFQEYSCLDYLRYNDLLSEIGRYFKIESYEGTLRYMTPSEVDMALYMYDKIKGETASSELKKQKIDQIMAILHEIAQDVYSVANEEWAIKTSWSGRLRGSANKLMREMRIYAERGDLDGIFRYYQNALGDPLGHKVGMILKEKGKKSLESEYERVRIIYSDP